MANNYNGIDWVALNATSPHITMGAFLCQPNSVLKIVLMYYHAIYGGSSALNYAIPRNFLRLEATIGGRRVHTGA